MVGRMTADITHRAGGPLHLRWSYGADLSDVDITAVVSGPAGEVGRLKVLRTDRQDVVDLLSPAADVGRWPTGQLALDVRLLRGDVAGRLDTVLIDLKPEAA